MIIFGRSFGGFHLEGIWSPELNSLSFQKGSSFGGFSGGLSARSVPLCRWAKNPFNVRDRLNFGSVVSSKWLHGVLFLGVGMNFKLSPSRDLRFAGGLIFFVRSWNAMVVGRLKYVQVSMVASRSATLWRVLFSIEAMNPKANLM